MMKSFLECAPTTWQVQLCCAWRNRKEVPA